MSTSKPKTRKDIERYLTQAFIDALDKMNLPQDATHMCRVFRALLGIGFTCMHAGEAPASVVAEQLERVLDRRLTGKKKKEAQTEPGTLGSRVLKPGRA